MMIGIYFIGLFLTAVSIATLLDGDEEFVWLNLFLLALGLICAIVGLQGVL